MNRRAWAVLAISAVACGKGSGTPSRAPAGPPEPPEPGAGSPPASATTALGSRAGGEQDAAPCTPLPFAESTPVPEASGAAWLTIDGKDALVIAGDSGNRGAYGIIDPETGATLETGALPLSTEAGDDLEGLAARGDRLIGLTSSGWIRVWQRSSGSGPGSGRRSSGFELIEKAYPLGPVDLPRRKTKARAPRGDGMVCDPHAVNCGRNYEGLCIAPAPREGACIGFAAAKADGHLYCLTEEAGKLVVHRDHAIAITRPGALADCAFGDDNTLWAGSNLFDLGNVYRITHWEDPASAQVERVGGFAIGFPEVIAARGDVVYRMSDLGGAPSLTAKYRCRR